MQPGAASLLRQQKDLEGSIKSVSTRSLTLEDVSRHRVDTLLQGLFPHR